MAVTRLPGGNGSTPDGCALAQIAHERASDALEGVRTVYGTLGGIAAEIAGLRAELREGLRLLGVQHAKTSEDVEEIEDTLVKNLREELAHAKGEAGKWKWWLLGIAAAILGGVLTAVVLAALGVHK